MRTALLTLALLWAAIAEAVTGQSVHAQTTAQPVVRWTECEQHLVFDDLTRIHTQTCAHYPIKRQHRPQVGWKTRVIFNSPHIHTFIKFPTWQAPPPPPAPPVSATLPACYYSAVRQYSAFIYSASRISGVPAGWLAAQIEKESSGDPSATSQGVDGADIGLMQYGPDWAAKIWATYRMGGYSYDPATNILTGALIDAYLMRYSTGGNLFAAMQMYNAGYNLSAGYGYAAWIQAHVCG